MKKETFSIIFVPHDLKKTRTYRVSYGLFYTFLVLCAGGFITLIVFVATYGKLLIKTRETIMLERQVDELTRRNEQVGEVMRNLARVRAMDLHVRNMLGLDIEKADSLISMNAGIAGGAEAAADDGEHAQMIRAIPSFWPVRGYITRRFNIAGGRDSPDYHGGIDIGVDRGTPVRAAAGGYVVDVGWNDVYGYYVRLDHGYGVKTLYGHNDRLVVMKGERVGRGQTIAYSGNTGRSSAPHLHFEIARDNKAVDPLQYLMQ